MKGSEFFEGVRCLLVDRKDKPKWKYDDIALIPESEVKQFFQPFADPKLELGI
jgi:hypothetical protein